MNAPPDKVVVAAGGFVDEREVKSPERATNHEEADTCLIVHCINSSLDNIIVSAIRMSCYFLSHMYPTSLVLTCT